MLGYNNAIVLTQPMHIDDLKYLRNPLYAYGDWLSVGQVSKGGRFLDNPGDPENWSNSYTQYIAEAAWRSYQIHGGQPAIAGNLARYAEGDVKGQLAFYDHDNNGAHRVRLGRADRQRRRRGVVPLAGGPAGPGRVGLPVQRRAGRRAGLRRRSATPPRPPRCSTLADRIQNAIINVLWNPNRQLFEHRHVATNAFVPWKEINNYYPFAVGAMPNTASTGRRCGCSTTRPQYPIFPFYTANQVDKAAAAAAGSPAATTSPPSTRPCSSGYTPRCCATTRTSG